jgi:hypothetical protein
MFSGAAPNYSVSEKNHRLKMEHFVQHSQHFSTNIPARKTAPAAGNG